MTAIGPGDFVECIKAGEADGEKGLWVGSVYTCSEVVGSVRDCTVNCTSPGFGLRLVGVPNADPTGAWCGCGFRPISGGQKGMFDHLKKGVDAKIKEPA